MRKRISKLFFYFIAVVFLIGFTIQHLEAQPRADVKKKSETVQYNPKVNNFLVLIDATQSMGDSYKGQQKLVLAKNFISRMNQSLPDLHINSALRKFGPLPYSDELTVNVLELTPYSKKTFEEAIQKITTASGFSPMTAGINASSDDLKTAQGKIALIIISDWAEIGGAPIAAAEKMKLQFGDRICIYPVMVGNDQEGMKLMAKVSDAGKCGFVTNAEQVALEQDMDQLVEKIFFTKSTVVESVIENVFEVVPEKVVDSDNDGIPDNLDKCPGTPDHLKVDSNGCPIQETINLNIEFDSGKSVVKSKYHDEIKRIADIMKQDPQKITVIEGYTDNVGNKAYNIKLSQSRADNVRAYLIDKFGIEKDRLKAVGYGFQKPLASNKTAEGKQKNRRVQATISIYISK
jgi:OmpA-OmpF porin, OOP family